MYFFFRSYSIKTSVGKVTRTFLLVTFGTLLLTLESGSEKNVHSTYNYLLIIVEIMRYRHVRTDKYSSDLFIFSKYFLISSTYFFVGGSTLKFATTSVVFTIYLFSNRFFFLLSFSSTTIYHFFHFQGGVRSRNFDFKGSFNKTMW